MGDQVRSGQYESVAGDEAANRRAVSVNTRRQWRQEVRAAMRLHFTVCGSLSTALADRRRLDRIRLETLRGKENMNRLTTRYEIIERVDSHWQQTNCCPKLPRRKLARFGSDLRKITFSQMISETSLRNACSGILEKNVDFYLSFFFQMPKDDTLSMESKLPDRAS